MPQPSSYVDWDTSATNTIAVTSGHAANGVAVDEVPASGEWNQWMMLVGLWIRWLAAGGHTSTTRRIPPTSGTNAIPADAYFDYKSWVATNAGATLVIPLIVSVGEEITQVNTLVSCGATDVINWQLFKYNADTQTATQIGATQHSFGHAGATESVGLTGLTETVPSGTDTFYSVLITLNAFATAPTVYGTNLIVQVP